VKSLTITRAPRKWRKGGLRESSQGSNEDERENDTLSRALGTKEQRDCVRGVSSKLTWKEGFPAHKSSY
jgi:hypothetical protein